MCLMRSGANYLWTTVPKNDCLWVSFTGLPPYLYKTMNDVVKRERVPQRRLKERKSALVALIHSCALSLIILACNNDNRQTAHIPDYPKPGDSSRTERALLALTRAINQSSSASAYAKRAALRLATGQVSEALTDINEAISRNDNVRTT